MDKIIEEQINRMAQREWWYQMAIILLGVLLFLSFMSKHFKTIIDILPSVRKFFAYTHKRWFHNAIFRSDVLKKLEVLQLQGNKRDALIEEIAKEVKYNGGSSIKDTVRRMEQGQAEVIREVRHLRGLREISDKYDATMKFKYDPEQGVTFISESFLRTFGCKETDVMYYGYEGLLNPLDVPEMWDKWKRAISTCTPFHDVQRIRDMIGIYHTCDIRARPIVIDDSIVEFVGVIEITHSH